ncbi:MAG: GAF domain-containing protein [Syntrophotaleaceae bacterium]
MKSVRKLQDNYRSGMEVIDEICRAIIRADDLPTISGHILDLAIGYTGAEKGTLMLLDNRGELYIHSCRGFQAAFGRSYRVRIGEGIAGRVARDQEPVLVIDIEHDERFKGTGRDRYKTRSFISCPIIGQDELLGVLNINDKKGGGPFSEEEFSLVRVLASQAALALKNAYLLGKYKEKTAHAEELNRKLIESDLAKTDFLTRLSHELRTPLNSIMGAVYYLKNTPARVSTSKEEFLGIISSEAERMTAILEKQFDYLRLENENRVGRKTIISLGELLADIQESHLVKASLNQYQIRLELDPESDRPDLVADRIQFGQMLVNLIQGLAGQVSRGAVLHISVHENEVIELILSAGEKLPAARLRTLFQANEDFGRQESTPKLKLFLARKAVEANGWKLETANGDNGFFCRLLIPRLVLEMEDAALDMTMGRMLEFVSETLGVNTSSLMLCDRLNGDLVIRSARGLDEDVVRGTRLRLGDRLAGWVAAEGEPLLVKDIEGDPRFGSSYFSHQYSSRSLLSLPLKIRGAVIGVLNLTDKNTDEPFTETDLHVAQVMVERISKFIENLKGQAGKVQKDYRGIIASLDSLIAARSRYEKRGSCYPELVGNLMKELRAEEKDREQALYIALIYDLGLVLLDRRLMEKKRNLSGLEMTALQNHPYCTLELLQDFEPCEDVKRIILHHHEHFDGSGYPNGLKGDEIPLISRVLAVVDSYCAMIEDRPYRKAFTSKEALSQIRQGAGSQYDPRVVAALERVQANFQSRG